MYKTELPVEVVSYLERLDYEFNGLRNLVVFAERSKQDNETFDRIMQRYREAFCERQMALEEVRSMFVPAEYQTQEYRFRIDYPKCLLEIEKAGVADA